MHQWVMSDLNTSCHVSMSHVSMSRVRSEDVNQWVMSDMHQWVMSDMNTSCHVSMSHVRYQYVMSRVIQSRGISTRRWCIGGSQMWMSHDLSICVWDMTYLYVTWLICMRHDSFDLHGDVLAAVKYGWVTTCPFVYVTWLMCMRHDSFDETWLISESRLLHVWLAVFIRYHPPRLLHSWLAVFVRDSFIYTAYYIRSVL